MHGDGHVKQGDDSVYEFTDVSQLDGHKVEGQMQSYQYTGGNVAVEHKKKPIQRTKYPGSVQVGPNGEKRKIYQCSECAFYSHR